MKKSVIYTSKSHMLQTYTDNVDIIGRTIRGLTSVFSKIEKEQKWVYAGNEDKTMLMVSKSKASTALDQSVNVDKLYNFEVVDEFIYLGSRR